ncbi:MAG: hypothetical protein M3P30_03530 [Chloroflexota bacterium]|nr:hypothetical protein [Chloroflexota bacterium]
MSNTYAAISRHPLRYLATLVLGAGAVMTLVVGGASASNVHLKKSPALTFTDKGLYLEATGALTGLGNGDIVVTLSASGHPTGTCTNPGGHDPAGLNPAAVVTLTGAQEIPSGTVTNGNVAFDVSTGSPTTPVAGAPDCPNSNYTENITDVSFSGFSATITVYQGTGCAVNNDGTLTSGCNIANPVFVKTVTVP